MLRVACLLAFAASALASAGQHDAGIGHGAAQFEWAGVFETPDNGYFWSAEKVNGKYADPHMKMVALPLNASECQNAELWMHQMENEAIHSFNMTCTEVAGQTTQALALTNGVITPAFDACSELEFEQTSAISYFNVNTANAACTAFYTAHFPTEFEDTQHYLQNATGADNEPLATIPTAFYEWAGIFSVHPFNEAGPMVWLAQKTDPSTKAADTGGGGGHGHRRLSGDDEATVAYVDPSMVMSIFPASKGDCGDPEKALKDHEVAAKTSFRTMCQEVKPGAMLFPEEDHCYNLVFDQAAANSRFHINSSNPCMIVFAQHKPTEFERSQHYLYYFATGEDIEPLAELPVTTPVATDKPWGQAIGAACCVVIITLFGVILLIPAVRSAAKKHERAFFTCCNGFAAGAIMAAAFYLLLFEATHLISPSSQYPDEQEGTTAAMWGSMILCGFISAAILDLCVLLIIGKAMTTDSEAPGARTGASSQSSVEDGKEGGPVSNAPSPPPSPPDLDLDVTDGSPVSPSRIICGVLIGDFVHNFCDGIFIGAGFLNCDNSVGWSITAATVYHEIAQEISDFVVLTNPNQGGMKPITALAWNFVSGLSVILGVVIILGCDVDSRAQGLLLAYGGGVYLQIGAAECIPSMNSAAGGSKLLRLAGILAFAFGAFCIGVVLFDHKHCIPTGNSAIVTEGLLAGR